MRKDGTIRPLSSRRTRPFGEFLGQLGHAAMSNGDERVPRYDRAMFARRLQAAIDRLGLTYEETARRAREHLPPDARGGHSWAANTQRHDDVGAACSRINRSGERAGRKWGRLPTESEESFPSRQERVL